MSRPFLLRFARTSARIALTISIAQLSTAAQAETIPPKPQPAVRPQARLAKPAPMVPPPPITGVQAMAGRWSGNGLMTLTSGSAEPFKCVMTNAPSADGLQMKQNLRCRGEQNSFDAVTFLSIDGPNVTGRWQDNIYSLDGTVRGTTTTEGMNLLLDGRFFQAQLIVVSSGCQQTVRVVPTRNLLHEGDRSRLEKMLIGAIVKGVKPRSAALDPCKAEC